MVTADYLPDVGGIASHVDRLAEALRLHDVDVQVWKWIPSGEKPTDLIPGVRYLTARGAWNRGRSLWDIPSLVAEIRSSADEVRPSVLHVHTLGPLPFSTQLARRTMPGTACVLTNHSSGYLEMAATARGRLKAKALFGGQDAVIAPSAELERESAYIADKRRRHHIPNGVDPQAFVPQSRKEARVALGLPVEPFLIVTTRRFERKNGLRYLVEAMGKLSDKSDAFLVMIGGPTADDEWRYIQDYVRRNKLSDVVNFAGSLRNNLVGTYLSAANVVVVPSLMEATSISALEAMASGRAVIGTTVGGLPELVSDGLTGRLVPPRSAIGLAEAIDEFVGDPSKADEMGKAARQVVKTNFTWDGVARRTLRVYQQALETRENLVFALNS